MKGMHMSSKKNKSSTKTNNMSQETNTQNEDKNTKNTLNNPVEGEVLSDAEKESLIKQINTLSLSENTLYIFVTAILMNLSYIIWLKNTLIDKLNNTTSPAEDVDLSMVPRITNLMLLYGTSIFLLINFSGFQDVLSLQESTPRQKCRAWKIFISSLLVFIATGITSGNLEL